MKALIFNGTMDIKEDSVSIQLANYLSEELNKLNVETNVFKIAEAGIPLFDVSLKNTPDSVVTMNQVFRDADVHVWLTPLYHGSMTGVMKNCLDWLEYSAKLPEPYLTGKVIGLVCWADGVQAMQGINTMDAVAKSLRAWTAPLSIPAQRSELFDEKGNVSARYKERFEMLLNLLIHKI